MGLPFINYKEHFVEFKADGDTVEIIGNIDVQNPNAFMSPFFERVHNSIIEHDIKKIKLDITKLQFINSSGIKELIGWITKLDYISENNRYMINIKINENILWQERSVSTLVNLFPDYITKE